MRAICQDGDAARMAAFGDSRERQHQRALRRDVIDDGERRLRADRSGERLHDVIRRSHRVWHLRHAHGRAPLARGKHHGPRHPAIAEIRDEDLVVGPDRPGAKNRVRAGRRVVDEHEVVAAHANELADGVGRLTQAAGARLSDARRRSRQSSRSRYRLGLRSMSSRMPRWASSTGSGVTPTVP